MQASNKQAAFIIMRRRIDQIGREAAAPLGQRLSGALVGRQSVSQRVDFVRLRGCRSRRSATRATGGDRAAEDFLWSPGSGRTCPSVSSDRRRSGAGLDRMTAVSASELPPGLDRQSISALRTGPLRVFAERVVGAAVEDSVVQSVLTTNESPLDAWRTTEDGDVSCFPSISSPATDEGGRPSIIRNTRCLAWIMASSSVLACPWRVTKATIRSPTTPVRANTSLTVPSPA